MSRPVKGRADYFALGDYNAYCFECGTKYKASELMQHWQGYFVCSRCFEPRQPQDFVHATQDVQTVPWSQNVSNVFSYYCGPLDRSAIAGLAVAGCATTNYVTPDLADMVPPVGV